MPAVAMGVVVTTGVPVESITVPLTVVGLASLFVIVELAGLVYLKY